jgi:NADPH-dependent 7-cyano-7-deazaguanine reductase QueF
MILLKPTFDVHISEMNSLKVTALAATEMAKRYLQSFFKSNDTCHQLTYDKLEDLLDFCYSRNLKVFLDGNVRRGDECSQD